MADDVIGKLQFIVEVDNEKGITSIKKFKSSIDDATKTTQDAEKNQKKAFEGINLKATAVASAVGVAVVKMAKEVMKATNTMQDGRKIIVQATGATGEALDSLMESAKNVFATVDESFDEVSTALGEINTRFGYTGQILEDTTRMFLDFAEATGQDVKNAVKTSAQVINQWNLSAEEMPLLLDKLTVAGQVTGVAVSQLSTNLTDSAGTLQAMGYGLDEAISLMMTFEKQGIDSSAVLMGMKQSFAQSAKAGTDARKDWDNLIKSITNATDEATANEKAINAFGNRIASTLVTALRSGKISTNEFADALNNAQGALSATDEAGKTTADRLQVLKNQLTIALADMGEAFAPIIEKVLPLAVDVITKVSTVLGWVADRVSDVINGVEEFLELPVTKTLEDTQEVIEETIDPLEEYNKAFKEQGFLSATNFKTMEEFNKALENGLQLTETEQTRIRAGILLRQKKAEATEKDTEAVEGNAEATKKHNWETQKALKFADEYMASMESETGAVRELTAEEKAQAEERKKNSEKYVALLKNQRTEAKKTLSEELKAQGLIQESYKIRLDLVKKEHDKEKEELKKLIEAKKATSTDLVNLEQAQANEIRAINDEMYRDIDAQRQESINKHRQALKDMISAVNQDLGSSVHNLVQVMSDEFSTAEDKMKALQTFTASAFGQIGSALSDLAKDLVMGGDAWGNLGKSALRALAGIVRALAEEMTARAVVAAFTLNWGGAALLGAGATAAYIAAGLIEGWANSLLIGEDYVPYDNYPARLHKGEMVLTRQDADRFRDMGGLYGIEKATSVPLSVSSANGINSVNVNSNLSAVIEVDGVQLGVAVLKNIDDASQFILR